MDELQTKECSTCKKSYELSCFIGFKGQQTKGCNTCREKWKINDKNRDKEHRNKVARKNDAKPERIAVKKLWNEQNHDKVALKSMNYRQRKIESVGIDEYLKQNAANAKKWRDNHPDKMKEINENKKADKVQNYKVYQHSANLKQLEFTLTFEDYVSLSEMPCYYCGIIEERGFNGIDRTDQTVGYLLSNCVSCCQMCNYIKGSLSEQTFIKRAIHIMTNKHIANGQLYAECFSNHKRTSYSGYKERALKKQFDFTITEDEFHNITANSCYLCGKQNSELHSNGLDRIDSNKGYTLDNLQSCCGECNYMKKNYDMDEFMNKLTLIYEKHKFYLFTEIENTIVETCIGRSTKKSKTQIAEESKLRKQKSRSQLIQKYNDEEYKQNRAKELAKNREMAQNEQL
jgi:hypothetical protein